MAWGLWFQFWLVLLTLWAGFLVICWSYIDRDSPMIHRSTRWWGQNLLRVAHIPVEVEGLEHLVPGQAYVFAANHRSNFDIFALVAVLPGRFLWVAKKSLFHIPVLGQALSRMGSIPVDRDNLRSAVKSLDQATAIVKSGVSLIIFPEGTRVPHGEAPPLRAGFAGLYTLLGLPVVPIALNSGLVSPKGSFLKKAGVITYKVGEVVPAGLDRREAEARVHAAINALNPPSALLQ